MRCTAIGRISNERSNLGKRFEYEKNRGLVLLVVGAGRAIRGYRQFGFFGARLDQAVTGPQIDKDMFLHIGDAACIVAGLFLAPRK